MKTLIALAALILAVEVYGCYESYSDKYPRKYLITMEEEEYDDDYIDCRVGDKQVPVYLCKRRQGGYESRYNDPDRGN